MSGAESSNANLGNAKVPLLLPDEAMAAMALQFCTVTPSLSGTFGQGDARLAGPRGKGLDQENATLVSQEIASTRQAFMMKTPS